MEDKDKNTPKKDDELFGSLSDAANESQEEQIMKDFLKDFMATPGENKTSTATDLARLSPDDYLPVKIQDETTKKIEYLQQLSSDIEKKSSIDYEKLSEQISSNYKIDYRHELNPPQLFAATRVDKPMLIIAGAGSGKTRTIVYRVGFLLENNVDPQKILLLTFTRKAAREMITRTIKLMGTYEAERVVGGTFHAFANLVLRKYCNFLRLPPKFTIIDAVDSEDIISLIRDEVVKGKKAAFPKKGRLFEIISKSRNIEIDIPALIEKEYTGLEKFTKQIQLIANTYHQYKKAHYIFDYDDLLVFLRDTLEKNLKFRGMLQKAFDYILVDEYQDTNKIQKEIVDFLAEKHRQVMMVGDDSQSIYSFRGANYENILRFPETYPDGIVVKLEQNYRSNQPVLNFANSVIHHSKLGYKKKLFTVNEGDFVPVAKIFYDQEEEAGYIVSKILELREKDIPLDSMAVIYRASHHGNFVQAELLKRGIPYVVVGGIKFTERRHVRDIIAYLRIIVNPLDASSWNRILKLIPGIGNAGAKNIILDVRKNQGGMPLDKYKNKKYFDDLQYLDKTLNQCKDDSVAPGEMVMKFREYYTPLLKKLESDYESRLLDINVLKELSAKYADLEKFLSDFALDPPSNRFQDKTTPLIDEQEENPLTLTTVHSAKGLEWYAVFIPHLLDGLFPSSRSMGNLEELEEERRLFYVATTRAKEQLYLTMPSYFSSWDVVFTRPSRFLAEIDKSSYICE